MCKNNVPMEKQVTCASHVSDHRPLKDKPYHVRITIGGNKLDYNNSTGSLAANLLETKILLNSAISDANKSAQLMYAHIKDYFLVTPIDRPKCVKVNCKQTPRNIKVEYNLDSKVTSDRCIYTRMQKRMLGLKQAVILAYQVLKNCLERFRHEPIKGNISLQHYKSKLTKFCLYLDDFGIKYWSKEAANHLCNAIGANFCYAIDLEEKIIVD